MGGLWYRSTHATMPAVPQSKVDEQEASRLRVCKDADRDAVAMQLGSMQEEEVSDIAPVARYTALGIICLMAFSIRLFAVVRWESVRA